MVLQEVQEGTVNGVIVVAAPAPTPALVNVFEHLLMNILLIMNYFVKIRACAAFKGYFSEPVKVNFAG